MSLRCSQPEDANLGHERQWHYRSVRVGRIGCCAADRLAARSIAMRILFKALMALVAGLMVLISLFWWKSPQVMEEARVRAESSLSRSLGQPVEIHGLKLSFDPLSLHLGRFRIGESTLQVENFTLKPLLRGSLSRGLPIVRAEVERVFGRCRATRKSRGRE